MMQHWIQETAAIHRLVDEKSMEEAREVSNRLSPFKSHHMVKKFVDQLLSLHYQ